MYPIDIEPDDEEKLEKLPEDGSTPFSLPDDVSSTLADGHPALDSGLDAGEEYDLGRDRAAEVTDNSKNVAVKGLVKDAKDPARKNGPVKIIKPANKSVDSSP